MARSKTVVLVDNRGYTIIKQFKSIQECAVELFVDPGTVVNRCRQAFERYHAEPFICFEADWKKKLNNDPMMILTNFMDSKQEYLLLSKKEVGYLLEIIEMLKRGGNNNEQ